MMANGKPNGFDLIPKENPAISQCVYFYQEMGDHPKEHHCIAIGESSKGPWDRMLSGGYKSSRPLKLIAWIPGGTYDDEQLLLKRFEAFRSNKLSSPEWFYPVESLLRYIDELLLIKENRPLPRPMKRIIIPKRINSDCKSRHLKGDDKNVVIAVQEVILDWTEEGKPYGSRQVFPGGSLGLKAFADVVSKWMLLTSKKKNDFPETEEAVLRAWDDLRRTMTSKKKTSNSSNGIRNNTGDSNQEEL